MHAAENEIVIVSYNQNERPWWYFFPSIRLFKIEWRSA